MHYLNVWLKVKNPGDVPQVRALLATAGQWSRQEPGCARFEVYQSQADPARFLLCEHWETKEALEVHRTARAFTEIYQPQVLPLVEREPHESSLVQ